MKRKALITATAVLLVAVMCLATASYAWFTSGSAGKIAELDIGVSAGDSGLEIAIANMKDANASYEAGAFTTDALAASFIADNGWLPASNTLDAVSTSGAAADGKFTFIATDYKAGTWTGKAADNDEYVLFSFYVKSSQAGKHTVTFTSELLENENFKAAGKIGFGVVNNTGVKNTGDTPAAKPTSFTTYAISSPEAYQDMVGVGAKCTRDADTGAFVADADQASNTDYFVASATNGTWAAQTLEFAAEETKLVTVALWIEGMDSDCAGSWTAAEYKFNVTIA